MSILRICIDLLRLWAPTSNSIIARCFACFPGELGDLCGGECGTQLFSKERSVEFFAKRAARNTLPEFAFLFGVCNNIDKSLHEAGLCVILGMTTGKLPTAISFSLSPRRNVIVLRQRDQYVWNKHLPPKK